jgi:hypothetical protein
MEIAYERFWRGQSPIRKRQAPKEELEIGRPKKSAQKNNLHKKLDTAKPSACRRTTFTTFLPLPYDLTG